MTEKKPKNTRGGARAGAGRKPMSGLFGEKTVPVRVPASKVNWVRESLLNNENIQFEIHNLSQVHFKLLEQTVSAGEPFVFDSSNFTNIELKSYLLANSKTDFLVRVSGDSMIDAGIYDGDMVVVTPASKTKHNDIVVACVDGSVTLKRFIENRTLQGVVYILRAENVNVSDILISNSRSISIIGLVIGLVRKL